MTDQTLLGKARKGRFDDLPNFSEHPSEDVERFLKSIKNITKANDESDNPEILEIVRGKLTQSAGMWFDNNESIFKKWSDFETAFRNRYFPTTLAHQNFDKLKQRKQQHDEPVTSYFDDVVKLCREIDPDMSDKIIIHHLMSGLNPDFKKELSRRESSMNTLSEFLKHAKIEEDLYDTFEKSPISSLTTWVKQPTPRYHNLKPDNRLSHLTHSQRSVPPRNSTHELTPRTVIPDKKQIPNYPSQSIFNKKSISNQPISPSQFSNYFLKTIHHHNFLYQTHLCQTANSTPLNLIGQTKLEIQIKSIKTCITAHVATNLITSILLGNDWINSNHVHLYGDQKKLTIPDQHGQLISIPCVEPTSINYPALLLRQVTLPPHSQTLVDITCQISNAHNLIFEPYERHVSKFIFIPHTLLNINKNQAKILLINAQDRQQTLPRNTRIGTLSRHSTYTIYATTQPDTARNFFSNKNHRSLPPRSKQLKSRAVSCGKDNSHQIKSNAYCHRCHEYFLSGNDLQKHLRAKCYSEQIRQQILESTKHIENRKHQLAIQHIL
ncbi:unnamed protein product [Rotaria sp. Silwood2]|nr:unnamed protein product [Rotaria sp. Silwood2]CAF3292732.1 unnamed protein product [Rotaria sp. Silwood2]CAF4407192.1 unnamed protein product [Rotaria sp. Silwood2]CAF4543639.1 unnamed protein product [Rotaria sp. Silwood2]CAF4591714.1 unnamed protein product [Rotaria sp. Silwood2]